MLKLQAKFLLTTHALFFPLISNAQDLTTSFSNVVVQVIILILPIIGGASLLYFAYGFYMYVRWYHDSGKQEQGRDAMTWAVTALFFLAVIWWFMSFLQGAFELPVFIESQ
ncbi:hypothetical protein CL631_00475 [bacterium]|nr:hypothetical protein [bacterium]|tara:strand:+ start:2144 stop:2476 length:333 start_codon:yes stop_codon:yes gene_type:complete